MFPETSRYYQLETAKWTSPAGREIVFLRRRFLPRTDAFTLLADHRVAEGDRLDNVTALHLGDPEQFWRVCDANSAMRPEDLTAEINRTLHIPLPQ